MSKLTVTNFSKRTGSPFQNKSKETEVAIVHEEVLQKTHYEKQKEKQSELIQKVNKKTAEYQSNKPSSGIFTEVVTHGAFTTKSINRDKPVKVENATTSHKNNAANGSSSKSLMGFPSSANDLALDAKSDLESDPNISAEVKEKVIQKLFALVSMVQHNYESKVRVMTDFEKFKDTHMKNELRREKEHSEQLYKLNMNFQNEVVQSIQRLKSELDISRNVSKSIIDSNASLRGSSVDFNTFEDVADDSIDNSDKLDDVFDSRNETPDNKTTGNTKSE
ncbi:uncharacterized protein LOC115442855 [Manduca sexta]|uniref:Uncharacterized protein n=1 Tax=Manduca sexta TaxID=7130 RepID=A0A921Z2C0_MANSE|nr:uncharacterized protein LOC115442855 [Manduca sexta]KAG6449042.1 hypothetical protein O3G_MSEX005855 [Manduca sexta]